MNIVQIKSFLAVVKTNSFTQASELLYLSQSNVSKHIISLEKEFKHKLFKRKGRQIELTDFGRFFLEKVLIMEECHSSIKNRARQISDAKTKTIRLATIPILYNPIFVDLFDQFKANYKDIKLIIEEKEPADVTSAIKAGLYDYGLVRDFYDDISDFISIPIAKARLVAIVSKNHPLARHKIIKLKQLEKEKFISVYLESRVHTYTLECCKSVGFTPNIEYNLRRMSNVYKYVGRGEGVALIFCHCTEDSNHGEQNVVKLELADSFESQVLLIKNKNPRRCNKNNKFENYMAMNNIDK